MYQCPGTPSASLFPTCLELSSQGETQMSLNMPSWVLQRRPGGLLLLWKVQASMLRPALISSRLWTTSLYPLSAAAGNERVLLLMYSNTTTPLMLGLRDVPQHPGLCLRDNNMGETCSHKSWAFGKSGYKMSWQLWDHFIFGVSARMNLNLIFFLHPSDLSTEYLVCSFSIIQSKLQSLLSEYYCSYLFFLSYYYDSNLESSTKIGVTLCWHSTNGPCPKEFTI